MLFASFPSQLSLLVVDDGVDVVVNVGVDVGVDVVALFIHTHS